MPYEVKRTGTCCCGKGEYKVFKKGTTKTYSKKPMTKTKAQSQMRALYASENKNKKK